MIEYIAEHVDAEDKKRLGVDVEKFWVRGPNGKHLVLVSEVNLQDYVVWTWYNAKKARKLALQAAEAMRCLHRAGVGHGDFTNRNVLLKLQSLDDLTPDKVEQCFGMILKEKLTPKRG